MLSIKLVFIISQQYYLEKKHHPFHIKSIIIHYTSDIITETEMMSLWWNFNTLRPRQNGRHFVEDIFKCIFLNEDARISLQISLKFVPTVQINNIPALVQIMAWHRPGAKPLSEPMMVRLLTHICVTRPQWVNHWLPWKLSKWRFQCSQWWQFHQDNDIFVSVI